MSRVGGEKLHWEISVYAPVQTGELCILWQGSGDYEDPYASCSCAEHLSRRICQAAASEYFIVIRSKSVGLTCISRGVDTITASALPTPRSFEYCEARYNTFADRDTEYLL